MTDKKKSADPSWYQRMQRTRKLKVRIAEILAAWPTDGTSCTDQEMDVDDAFTAWNRDMGELPE